MTQNKNQDRSTYDLYVVEEGKPNQDGEVKTFWQKVGRGFSNRDGSLSLRLFLLPGTLIQVRRHQPREDNDNRNDNRNNRNKRS